MSESDSSDAPPLASKEFAARHRANEAAKAHDPPRTRTKKPGARARGGTCGEERAASMNSSPTKTTRTRRLYGLRRRGTRAAASSTEAGRERPKRKRRAGESDEDFDPDATPAGRPRRRRRRGRADCEGCAVNRCESLKASRLRKTEAALKASRAETAAATLRGPSAARLVAKAAAADRGGIGGGGGRGRGRV